MCPLSPAQLLIYPPAQCDPKSPWSDARVRKAASLAIDRKTLADIYRPGSGPLGSLGFEGDPFWVNFPPDPYDPAGAKKLLAEAGYPKGVQVGKLYPANGAFMPYGEQVATYLKAVGINAEIVVMDRAAWQKDREGGKMKDGAIVDTDQCPNRYRTSFLPVHCGKLWKLSGYSGVVGSVPERGFIQSEEGSARSHSNPGS